jgi:hypothetical protein
VEIVTVEVSESGIVFCCVFVILLCLFFILLMIIILPILYTQKNLKTSHLLCHDVGKSICAIVPRSRIIKPS